MSGERLVVVEKSRESVVVAACRLALHVVIVVILPRVVENAEASLQNCIDVVIIIIVITTGAQSTTLKDALMSC